MNMGSNFCCKTVRIEDNENEVNGSKGDADAVKNINSARLKCHKGRPTCYRLPVEIAVLEAA